MTGNCKFKRNCQREWDYTWAFVIKQPGAQASTTFRSGTCKHFWRFLDVFGWFAPMTSSVFQMQDIRMGDDSYCGQPVKGCWGSAGAVRDVTGSWQLWPWRSPGFDDSQGAGIAAFKATSLKPSGPTDFGFLLGTRTKNWSDGDCVLCWTQVFEFQARRYTEVRRKMNEHEQIDDGHMWHNLCVLCMYN